LSNDAHKSKVDSDLADRLDTLFDEDEPVEKPMDSKGHSKDPLDELKSLVMSIEWEITDDLMERFLTQIESLKTRFGEDRILVMFLQLLGSLGLYVKTNKGKAHPIAFKLLNSVYNSFENAATPGKISPSEKKKLLYVELNKYKELKVQIDSHQGPEPEPARPAKTKSSDRPPRDTSVEAAEKEKIIEDVTKNGITLTQQHFDKVIDSLKSIVLEELAGIREVVASLKNKTET
jgi:hypothetical protein